MTGSTTLHFTSLMLLWGDFERVPSRRPVAGNFGWQERGSLSAIYTGGLAAPEGTIHLLLVIW